MHTHVSIHLYIICIHIYMHIYMCVYIIIHIIYIYLHVSNMYVHIYERQKVFGTSHSPRGVRTSFSIPVPFLGAKCLPRSPGVPT